MSKLSHWFTETHQASGSAVGYRVQKQLHIEKTPFQTIEIYQTTDWGQLMVIDGCVMLTSRDNFLYHEMMTHPALFTHQGARHVTIIGGGDCGTLREVLRHQNVEKVTQIEIDERVTRLAEHYFPELCQANNDPRAELLFEDGISYINKVAARSLDMIIVDSTDPVGPAQGLFNAPFYTSCFRALRHKGMLVQQSESPFVHLPLIQSMHVAMRNTGFSAVQTLPFPQPCYPTGWWSCTMARKGGGLSDFRVDDVMAKPFSTRYYNARVHKGSQALPEFILEALKSTE